MLLMVVGDCWFVAAAASLATWSKKILHRCVPPDQDFEKDYAGTKCSLRIIKIKAISIK